MSDNQDTGMCDQVKHILEAARRGKLQLTALAYVLGWNASWHTNRPTAAAELLAELHVRHWPAEDELAELFAAYRSGHQHIDNGGAHADLNDEENAQLVALAMACYWRVEAASRGSYLMGVDIYADCSDSKSFEAAALALGLDIKFHEEMPGDDEVAPVFVCPR